MILGNPVNNQLVADRVGSILEMVSSRSSNQVTIVAVTKGFGVDAIKAAAKAGIYDIGENYAQEMMKKRDLLEDLDEGKNCRWHFIGNLQRNKVRKISSSVFMWQTTDSFALGEEIAKRSISPKLLLQVNMTGAETQGGIPPSQVPSLVEKFEESGINIEGLMTIGASRDRDATLVCFQELKKLANMLGLAECSMGMSDDYDLALEAGATILRLGRAIFGNRDPD
ncbi:MAG: YggS family pyridoxal phosphate-dependent enzyme [Acidimicrobiaceae bacterium]|jgi:pyridoxal phosphate enzyme (YggS family)|nr:YggS family pyridoxal phosphate-dependent enzyme [Acidimicrobiaceae bacterium]